MQYSLLSRFQGCLLGMTLGEQLGRYVEAQQVETQHVEVQPSGLQRSPNPPQTAVPLDIHRWNPNIQPLSTASSIQNPLWGKWVLHCIEDLIQSTSWKIEPNSIPPAWLADSAVVEGRLAIATLPIALFFHDNLVKQRSQIEEVVKGWSNSPELIEQVVTFGYAIAQALKEQTDPHTFIAQTLAYLRVTADPSDNSTNRWLTTLEQVRTRITGVDGQTDALQWQTTDANSGQIVQTDGKAIALALYYFMSTPNNFCLSILRAARAGHHPSIVCALTGALSGAYNSVVAIPVHWHLTSSTQQVTDWEPHADQIHQLSSRLLAVWSGVYDAFILPPSTLAVATPWVIRPR